MKAIKDNATTILVVFATVLLAGVAVFTAVRLYQLRGETVAPTSPDSMPAAAGTIIEIPIDTVIRGPGQHLLATKDVSEYSGLSCSAYILAANQESVHPDNDLIVTSGQSSVILEDVEGDPFSDTVAEGELLLSDSVSVTLDMGPDEVFSAGLTVTLDCKQPTPTPMPDLTSCTEMVFSLSGATPTPTPTPTPTSTPTASPTASPRPSSAPTVTPTSTTTPKATASAVAVATQTPTPQRLPDAGSSLPTILGLAAGVILLLGAALVAF